MWNLQISPFGQNDNTGGSNEKYGIFVQALNKLSMGPAAVNPQISQITPITLII